MRKHPSPTVKGEIPIKYIFTRLRIPALVILLSFFTVVSLLYIAKPGLVVDEAHLALDVSDYLEKLPETGFSPGIIPRVSNDYEGSTFSMVLALAFGLFGESVFVLRAVHVFFALGGLLCIHYVISRWFNKTTAFLTVFLLSISTTFIRSARTGNSRDEIFQIFLFWLGLLFIQRCLESGRKKNLYLAGFIFGLALNAKVMFLGYAVSGLFALLLFGPQTKVILLNRLFARWHQAVGFIFFFLIGASHYIIAVMAGGVKSLEWVWGNFSQNAEGWDNTRVFHNLLVRFEDFRNFLSSDLIPDSISTSTNPVMPVLFFLALLFVLAMGLPRRPRFAGIQLMFCLVLMYTVLLVLTCFIPGLQDAGHVIILIPIIELTVAYFISILLEYFKSNILGILLAVFFILPHAYVETRILNQYIHKVKNREMTGEYSSLMYDITEYMEKKDYRKVYSFTEIISMNVVFLTEGRIACPGDWPRPRYESFEIVPIPSPDGRTDGSEWQQKLDPRTFYTLQKFIQHDLLDTENTCIIGLRGASHWKDILKLFSVYLETRGQGLVLDRSFTDGVRRHTTYDIYRIE